MCIPREQIILAKQIEEGLAYQSQGEADRVTENPKFWFHDLQDDEILKNCKGYEVCALGFGLIGKYESPDTAKSALKRIFSYPVDKYSMIRGLGISKELFTAVNDLHSRDGLNAREIVKILRTKSLI